MKKFRYSRENDNCIETLTVKELIYHLSKYPSDMPVFGEWEGVKGVIEESSFSTKLVHKGNADDTQESLLIYVERY